MDFVTIVIGFLLSCTLLHALFTLSGLGKPKNLPPGPKSLPIIGHLHLLGDQPHQSLAKLAKIHGPIMFLKFGRVTTLVISSAAAAKEVLQKQDLAFSSRHVPDALQAHNIFQFSIIWLPVNNKWRNLRRTFKTHIFAGERLNANHHLRCGRVQDLVTFCQKSCQSGDSVDISQAAFRTTCNLLSNTIFSKDLTDPFQDSAKDLKELIVNMAFEAGKLNLADFFPVFKMFDPQGVRKRMTRLLDEMFKLFDGLIDERLEMIKLKKHETNNDILDICLRINQENSEEMDRNQIKCMLFDLFAAGTDTTVSTMEWAMAEVVRNPHILAKAKDELEQVVGKGKIVQEADISKLPYLECIIKECLRLHPPGPLLVPRKVENDVEINGYTVPKGTQVLVNAWALGRDPDVWEDVLEFKPERFLNSGLDIRGRDFELIPFGAGRRMCPGLPLAVLMVPVVLGSLINNFDWKLDGGIEPKDLDMNEKFGITLQKAVPFRAIPMPLK